MKIGNKISEIKKIYKQNEGGHGGASIKIYKDANLEMLRRVRRDLSPTAKVQLQPINKPQTKHQAAPSEFSLPSQGLSNQGPLGSISYRQKLNHNNSSSLRDSLDNPQEAKDLHLSPFGTIYPAK